MDAPTDTTFTYEIVDSPGQQTAKQAILWNEANLDDLLTDYNAHTHANIDTDDLAAAAKTGDDTKIVTGTEGTDGNLAEWNADGDLVDGPTPPSGTIVGTTDTQTLTNKTIDGDDNTLQDIPYSAIKSASRSGDDATLVTGTAGTDGNLAEWNADGDIVDGPTPPSGDIVGTTDTQTLTNKTIAIGSNTLTGLLGLFNGYAQRTKFTYKDTDEIYISPGVYHHNGTSEQILYWNSILTFQFGSGGSNAASEDLGASEWHYLYIDDSALSGALMVAGEFINNTTAPTYSVAKHGFYNGNDRCIGMFKTNGDSEIILFKHDGGDFLRYNGPVQDVSSASVTNTWEDHTLTIPDICTKAEATFIATNGTAATRDLSYRSTGEDGSGHIVGRTYGNASSYSVNTLPVYTNGSLSIDLYATSTITVDIYTNGYYFPNGM